MKEQRTVYGGTLIKYGVCVRAVLPCKIHIDFYDNYGVLLHVFSFVGKTKTDIWSNGHHFNIFNYFNFSCSLLELADFPLKFAWNLSNFADAWNEVVADKSNVIFVNLQQLKVYTDPGVQDVFEWLMHRFTKGTPGMHEIVVFNCATQCFSVLFYTNEFWSIENR